MKDLKKIQTKYGVSEYHLANGLRVLYKEEKAAQVVGVDVVFHVGSRNESRGHTGSTHILEHLLFKDSKNFNKANGKSITGYLEWMGAMVNATTWMDRTHYFEVVPADKVEEALALEADRMRNSLFSEDDLANEMTIVRNEYEISRNNPFEILDEAVMETAFQKHPYRIPTIGSKEDIEASTAKKLHEFYDTFYWPNNATLVVLGNISEAQMKKLVLKYFEHIPRSPRKIPEMKIQEPLQTRARKVSIKKPLGISIASLAYKAPRGRDKDFALLYIGVMILGGGFSSRLQKALIDTGLAAGVTVFATPLYDPGFVTFAAHVAHNTLPEKVLAVMRKEITRFVKTGPSAQELNYVRERILSDISAQRDGVMNELRALTETVAAGDWRLAYSLENEVKRVTPRSIQKAAALYLRPSGETSGILRKT